MKERLTDADYTAAAGLLGCTVAAVKAVAEVESAGDGFNPDGSIKLLFEGHHFHRYTHGVHGGTHPTLSYPRWTRDFYGKSQVAEHMRFASACVLDRQAALLSTSFGKFQIMGFNFAVCGARTVEEFYAILCEDEISQLAAFCTFIQNRGLTDELVEQRWADFARLYNGPEYAANRYDVKLAKAFDKHLRGQA
jgi:N-acetylmuramidase